MRKEDPHQTERDEANDTDDDSDWPDNVPSETMTAVPPNEVTAGIDVTLYDDEEFPPMVELHQNYPPEDGVEGDSVYLHGEHAALRLMSTLSELLSDQFEEVPWDV